MKEPDGLVTPSPDTLTLKVPNTLDAIQPATTEAEAWLEARQAAPKVTLLVALAIEELISNCVKYGYDDADAHVIDIVLSLDHERLTYRYSGRDFRLTDVHGNVVRDIIA